MKHFKNLGAVALMTLSISGNAINLHIADTTPDAALHRIDLLIVDIADRAETAWPDLAALAAVRDKVKEMASGEIETADITAHLVASDTGDTVLILDVGGVTTDVVIDGTMIAAAKIDDTQPAFISNPPGPSLLTTVSGMAASVARSFSAHEACAA